MNWGGFFIFNAICDAFHNDDDPSPENGDGCLTACIIVLIVVVLNLIW